MDLSSILSKPAAEIEAPVPLPVGIYLGQVEKIGEVREIGQNKTPGVDFTYRLTQALDVELPPNVELPRSVRQTHWLSENALFNFRTFLEKTLLIEAGQKTLLEMMQEAPNRMFRVEITQKLYTNRNGESSMINDVGKTFALE
jgi:hypothetical protein